jgi:ribosome-associated protein
MFKTKKIQTDTRDSKAPAKGPAPKGRSVKRAAPKPASKAAPKAAAKGAAAPKTTPGSRSVQRLIKAGAAKPAPSVIKSKKGSPLRKRVIAPVGKAKAAPRAAAAPANLLGADEPAMQAAQAAIDKKAFDILVLDVSEISGLCDRMIICSARSTTHLSSVSDSIEEALRKAGQRLLHSDGRRTAEPEWVLLDYGDLMVHVFRQQARTDYQLEEYYSDGKVLAKFENA